MNGKGSRFDVMRSDVKSLNKAQVARKRLKRKKILKTNANTELNPPWVNFIVDPCKIYDSVEINLTARLNSKLTPEKNKP